MKKAADKFVRIFAAVLAVLSVSILLFTLVSTLFLNRTPSSRQRKNNGNTALRRCGNRGFWLAVIAAN